MESSDNFDDLLKELSALSRDLAARLASDQYVSLKWRMKMESIGLAIFGLSVGFALSYLGRYFIHSNVFHWWDWMFFSFDIVGFCASSFGLWVNRRWLRAHRVAYRSMVGLANTVPGAEIRQHHLEQAYAAVRDLKVLAKRRDRMVALLTFKHA